MLADHDTSASHKAVTFAEPARPSPAGAMDEPGSGEFAGTPDGTLNLRQLSAACPNPAG